VVNSETKPEIKDLCNIELYNKCVEFCGNVSVITKMTCHGTRCACNNYPLNLTNGLSLNALDITNRSHILKMKISGTNITNVTSNVFHNLTFLELLDLSSNNISVLGTNVFSPLGSLYVLNISYNKIIVIQENLFNNNYLLKVLDLSNNQISVVGQKVFNAKPNLKDINFRENKCINHTFNNGNNIKLLKVLKNTLSENCNAQKVENSTKNCTDEDFSFNVQVIVSFYNDHTVVIMIVCALYLILDVMTSCAIIIKRVRQFKSKNENECYIYSGIVFLSNKEKN
jgi:Leucine-rich repeat (LRR) protein